MALFRAIGPSSRRQFCNLEIDTRQWAAEKGSVHVVSANACERSFTSSQQDSMPQKIDPLMSRAKSGTRFINKEEPFTFCFVQGTWDHINGPDVQTTVLGIKLVVLSCRQRRALHRSVHSMLKNWWNFIGLDKEKASCLLPRACVP